MIFQGKRWIFTALVVVVLTLTACAAATEAEPTPTSVSSIEGLPLPTDSPDEIVAVIVTPTPAAGETEEAAVEPTEAATEEAAETTPEATEAATEAATAEAEAEEATAEPTEEATAEATAEPTGEAEAGATEPTGEAAEGTAEPTGEATEQPSESGGDGEMAAANEEELINQGEDIYATQCAKCHQLSGRGMGSAFPALRDSDIVTAEDPAAAIDTVIHGREAMPSFENVLSPEEIAAVVSYIRNAWDNDASAVNPQEVQEVQETGGTDSETAQNQ